MTQITETWASEPSAPMTEPSVGQQTAGFNCGAADPGLFNWLFNRITAAIRNPNANGSVNTGTIN